MTWTKRYLYRQGQTETGSGNRDRCKDKKRCSPRNGKIEKEGGRDRDSGIEMRREERQRNGGAQVGLQVDDSLATYH